MTKLEQMRQEVDAIGADYAKAMGGNKAAGVRVRRAVREIKKLASEIRNEVLEARK